jgi:hypothetical protein
VSVLIRQRFTISRQGDFIRCKAACLQTSVLVRVRHKKNARCVSHQYCSEDFYECLIALYQCVVFYSTR